MANRNDEKKQGAKAPGAAREAPARRPNEWGMGREGDEYEGASRERPRRDDGGREEVAPGNQRTAGMGPSATAPANRR